MEFDLLKYSDTLLTLCTKGWTRRQLHDLTRQVMIHPTRIRVCSCLSHVWTRETLSFLNVVWIPHTEQ
jgi:hypothetical protein